MVKWGSYFWPLAELLRVNSFRRERWHNLRNFFTVLVSSTKHVSNHYPFSLLVENFRMIVIWHIWKQPISKNFLRLNHLLEDSLKDKLSLHIHVIKCSMVKTTWALPFSSQYLSSPTLKSCLPKIRIIELKLHCCQHIIYIYENSKLLAFLM